MISVLSLPNGQQLLARIIEEDEATIKVQYPLLMLLANPLALSTSLYTARYMPMASEGIVTFNKQNVVGVANIDPSLEAYYEKMVSFYRSKTAVYRTPDAESSHNELEALMNLQNEDRDFNPDDVLNAFMESRDKTKH